MESSYARRSLMLARISATTSLRLRALRAAVVEADAYCAGFHVAIVWTRCCSASAIFAPARDLSELYGVALKSASTRTMFERSSFT